MPATLFVGPAACGKTQHILDNVRDTARGFRALPVVCLPTANQVRSASRRLAQAGGALGVRVLTFDHLCDALLAFSPSPYVELPDEVKYRLMRAVTEALNRAGQLRHYAPIADKPGFLEEVLRLVAELKSARVDSILLQQRLLARNAPSRLLDLAAIYAAWQSRLRTGNWTDRAGLSSLAVESVEQGRVVLPPAWSYIGFDGFDNFTEVQLGLVAALAALPGVNVTVTLTGDMADRGETPSRPVHSRFHGTRRIVERTLGIEAERLPNERPAGTWQPALLHLRDTFRMPVATMVPNSDCVDFIAASSRALEVRAALRWLKARILCDNVPLNECGLVARHMQPYLLLVDQIAAEFGIPVHIEDGLPLALNPAIATLLNLLEVFRPGDDGLPLLPRLPLIDLWRAPYLDLRPFGFLPGDADLLDAAARLALVSGGLREWRAAFTELSAGADGPEAVADAPDPADESDEPEIGALSPTEARRLSAVFEAFVQQLQPHSVTGVEEHVAWLEEMIGPAPEADEYTVLLDEAAAGSGLNVMRCIGGPQSAPHPTAARDKAAVYAFKDVLRSLIWAQEVVGTATQSYGDFIADLAAAVNARHYKTGSSNEAVFVGATVQARGAPLRLLAVMGMAEGELPGRIGEDAFLREDDRDALRPDFPGIESSIESAEAEFFLATITQPRDALLLVRPRITSSGAPWEPSAYWNDLRARVDAQVATVALGRPVAPEHAASGAELLEAVAALRRLPDAPPPTEEFIQGYTRMLGRAAILGARAGHAPTPWDGDLAQDLVDLHYAADFTWSASALETYIACPFQFFVQKRLRVEARPEPEEGPSRGQIGNLYHHIMQRLYAPYANTAAPPPVERILADVDAVAGSILAAGPADEGFRAPPAWPRTCAQIIENVRRSVIALADVAGTPTSLEYFFGGEHSFQINPPPSPTLPWPMEQGAPIPIYMRGAIDRVDRTADGALLIIDYKTGVGGHDSKTNMTNGKKLQLAIYTLAAAQNAGGEHAINAFYFFVHEGRAAKWSLSGTTSSPDSAILVAMNHAGRAVAGIRGGSFAPTPPADGCPDYCAAAAFCWHVVPKAW